MDGESRRAAIAAYKDRKAVAGIYALYCRATGQRWIGRAADLNKVQNRLWFTLRHGGHPHRDLQETWIQCGAESFTFEEVERIDEEPLAYIRERILKERMSHWYEALQAKAL